MGDKNKSKMTRSVTENLSRDFLTRFMGSGWREEFGAKKDEGYVDEEKIELNLGLSLGGRFGIEKDSNTLIRSSSIAECFPIVRDENDALTVSPPPIAFSRLMRTTSLPLETEEWRKRKELQTLRRMEAKRRRTEKQRNAKDEGSSGVAQMLDEKKEVIDLNLRGRIEKDRLLTTAKQIDSQVTLPFGTYAWDVFGRESVPSGNGTGAAIAKGKAMHEFICQGSAESQGGSSSSDLDNRSLPGSDGCDTSPASNQDVGSSGTKTKGILGKTSSLEVENPSKQQSDMTRSQVREARTSALEDMPCVFTKGNGPNGRRVDGILYQYGKGEEVRIMCVCHGNFHSPAEFVKHAGGTDFTHPLRHIVVNPNSAPFM